MQPTTKASLNPGFYVLLFGVILCLALNSDFYTSTITSTYLSLALFSAVVVLVLVRRQWTDLLWVALGALVLSFLDYRIRGFKPMMMAGFSFAGLAAFGVLGVHSVRAQGEERKLLLYAFVPLVLFAGSEWAATSLLDITERLHPKTFDLFLFSFDSSLHVQISFLAGQLLSKLPWLRSASIFFYVALPLPLALVYAVQLRRNRSMALVAMLAFLATGPIGILFYNMLPACGPVHIFGAVFPWHIPRTAAAMRLQATPILIKGARNAIPSLHMTWVLLIWWNSRGAARWVRGIALAFVWFTVAATLGTGEHYFVDLVVAFPFSLMIQALCSYSLPFRTGERRTCFLSGIFVTLAWLALLSFSVKLFWISPLLPWAMVIATISSSILLWHRLMRAHPEVKPIALQASVATAGVS